MFTCDKLVGRYEGVSQALHVAVSSNLNVPGKKPFEVIILRYSDKNTNSSLIVAQRNVLDEIDQGQGGKFQGENVGLHGELQFNERRIKNMKVAFDGYDFCNAKGEVIFRATLIVDEFR